MSLGDVITDALRYADELKAGGMTKAERDAALEQTIRQVWLKGREWHYLCGNCSDYGLEMHQCPGDATCGRHHEHLPHDYGRACWCQAGAKFRKRERTPEDLVDAAAKTSRPKAMTRAGR